MPEKREECRMAEHNWFLQDVDGLKPFEILRNLLLGEQPEAKQSAFAYLQCRLSLEGKEILTFNHRKKPPK